MSGLQNQGCSAYGGRGALVLGLTWAEFVIATFFIGLRIYTRLKVVVSYAGWALFWAVLCWITGIITQVFLTLAVSYGLGNHVLAVVECGTYVSAAKWSIISGSMALLPIGLSKVAVVAFLLAILGPTKRYQRWGLIFLAFSNVALNIVQLIKTIYRCNPAEAAWNPAIPGNCHSQHGWSTSTSYLVGVWNILSDFILAFYPITMFSKLQMAFRVKVGLCVLMGLGVVAAVCGIMRTVFIHLAYSSEDPTYDSGPEVIWVWTEMWLVLIVSCVPPLWPLLRTWFRALRSEAFDASGGEFTSAPSGHSRSPSSLAEKGKHGLRVPLLKRPSPAATTTPQAKQTSMDSTKHLAGPLSMNSRTTSEDTTASFITLKYLKDTAAGDKQPSRGPWDENIMTPSQAVLNDTNVPITKDHYTVPRPRDTVTEAQMRAALRDSRQPSYRVTDEEHIVVASTDEMRNTISCTFDAPR